MDLPSRGDKPLIRVLIFLKEEVLNYPITGVTRCDGAVIGDYKSRGWDCFSTYAEMGMHCAKHVWICILNDDARLTSQDIASLDKKALDEVKSEANSLNGRLEKWVNGAICNESEVKQLLKAHCPETLTDGTNWKAVTWEATDIQPGYSAGFRFDRNKEA